MKRYALYEYTTHYPCGGAFDLSASSNSIDQLKLKASNYCDEMCAHIFDRVAEQVILELSADGWIHVSSD